MHEASGPVRAGDAVPLRPPRLYRPFPPAHFRCSALQEVAVDEFYGAEEAVKAIKDSMCAPLPPPHVSVTAFARIATTAIAAFTPFSAVCRGHFLLSLARTRFFFACLASVHAQSCKTSLFAPPPLLSFRDRYGAYILKNLT